MYINWQSTLVFLAGRVVYIYIYIHNYIYSHDSILKDSLAAKTNVAGYCLANWNNKQMSENCSSDLSQAWNHEPAILPYWHGGLQILSFVQQRFGAFRRSLSCKLVGSAEGGSYCNKHFKYPKYQLSQVSTTFKTFYSFAEARRAHQRTLPWTASESIWI